MIETLMAVEERQQVPDPLQLLSQISEKIQYALNASEVAAHLALVGQALNFERTKIWTLCPRKQCLQSVKFVGLPEPAVPIELFVAQSPYATQTMQAQHPVLFDGLTQGSRALEDWFAEQNILPPQGLWVSIPLRTATDRCLGMFTLDNVTKQAVLGDEHLQLLGMLGRHAAAALERASLYERKHRKQTELAVLFEVGRLLIARAVSNDMGSLLRMIRQQLRLLMDVGHFRVVLRHEETAVLETWLHVEDDVELPCGRLENNQGLIEHIIARKKGRFRPYGTAAYQAEHQIEAPDSQAKSWMGSVLRSNGRALGAIIVANYREAGVYKAADWQLLCSVADLVAGAVEAMWSRERERRDKERLALLQRVSKEMLHFAEENEEWLWLTVLTAITAHYGLGFNRAMILLLDENEQMLRGYLGIGYLAGKEGKAEWERAVDEAMTFEDYLGQLRAGQIQRLPLQDVLDEFELPWSMELGALETAASQGHPLIVPHDQVWQQLPLAFVRQFGATNYALHPLRHGKRVLGLLVVDNIHTRFPLNKMVLNHIQPLLTQAVLLSQYVRERWMRDQLIDMNLQVMARTNRQDIRATLLEICQAIQAMTQADFVVINLLQSEERPFRFVADGNVAVNQYGLPLDIEPPRPSGVSEHILRTGPLVVNSISGHFQKYCGQSLSQHPHFQAEQIASFIGVPIFDGNGDGVLGVFYLLYRRPQLFSHTDTKQVQLFASLTAVAIQHSRAAQEVRDDLRLIQDDNQQRIRELDILSDVLQESLAPDLTEVKIIRALLQATATLLNQPTTRICLFLRKWETTGQQTSRQVRYRYQLQPNQILSPPIIEEDLERGLVGQVFQTGETQSVYDVTQHPWRETFVTSHPDYLTRSELDVAIKSGEATIGVLSIKSPHVAAFSEDDQATWQRLAFVAGLALSNVNRQQQMQNVLSATRSVAIPIGLHDTLDSIVVQLHETVPELSCMTIWYSLPNSNVLTLGPHFGLHHPDALPHTLDKVESNVGQLMLGEEPVWAEDITAVSHLYGDFAERENICSTAAFPLRYNKEMMGVMFLNYRTPHSFAPQEQYLFSLLAEVVTASLRDAAYLEVERKERHRLQTIADIAEIVGTTLDAEEAIEAILAQIVNLFPSMKPYVLLYDARQQLLELMSASLRFYPLQKTDYAHLRRVPIDDTTLVSQAAGLSLESKTVELLIAEDVATYDAYVPVMADTRSQFCLTLMNNQELLGVLALESTLGDAFSDNDVATLRGIGHQLSLALERGQRSRELQFRRTVAATTAWASELAHEMNSELGLIRSWAYWIRDEPDDVENVREWANNIEAAAVQLVKTMTMSGNEPWAQETTPSLLDASLAKWVNDLVQKRSPLAKITLKLACPSAQVAMFSGALRRVVNHLVHNALDAADSIGVVPHLTLSSRCLNPLWAEIELVDNGPGIDESVRQTLLQEPKSTKLGDRRGFGLLFARSLVEDVKGELRVLPSLPGQGARFCFTVPIRLATE